MSNPCETTTQTKIPFRDEEHRECKSQVIMQNNGKREIRKCKIDGTNGILEKEVDENGELIQKCDWLAIDVETKYEIYIELKSSYNVEDGVEQITTTISKIAAKEKLRNMISANSRFVKLGYVVHSSRINPEFTPKGQTLKKRARQTHNVIVRFEHTPFEPKLDDLIDNLCELNNISSR